MECADLHPTEPSTLAGINLATVMEIDGVERAQVVAVESAVEIDRCGNVVVVAELGEVFQVALEFIDPLLVRQGPLHIWTLEVQIGCIIALLVAAGMLDRV